MNKVLLVITDAIVINDIDTVAKDYLEEYNNKIELEFIITHLLDELLFNLNNDTCMAGVTYGKAAAIDLLCEYEIPDFVIETIIVEMLKTLNDLIKAHLLPIPPRYEISYIVSKSNKSIAIFHKRSLQMAKATYRDYTNLSIDSNYAIAI